jgi:hypothetical protein
MTSILHSKNSIYESDEPIINSSYPEALYYGQFERTDEIDKRIFERTTATDVKLRPNFDPRPVDTRHLIFPMVPFTSKEYNNKKTQTPISKYLEYDTRQGFSPIHSKAPVDGFLRNVNIESSLRNQYFGMQHGAIQSTYIPSTTSDLYNVRVASSSTGGGGDFTHSHPHLFRKEEGYHTSGNKHIRDSNIGKDIFNNATKQQLRGGVVR